MMHASDAAALFAAPGDEDKDIEDNIDREEIEMSWM